MRNITLLRLSSLFAKKKKRRRKKLLLNTLSSPRENLSSVI